MARVDQRRIDNQRVSSNQPPELLGASEAAAFLGVKRATLYAYASRGWLKSLPDPSGKARRYLREDLARLKARHDARSGHGPVAASALRWGEPVLESAITELRPEGPRYRGRSAIELARAGAGFEAVSELLWTGALPARARWPVVGPGVAAGRLRALAPRGLEPPAALALCTAALAAHDLDRFGAPEALELERARALLRRLAAALSLSADPTRLERALEAETVAQSACLALLGSAPREAVRLVDAALVLCADHELNPSTFTARVAASSGADLYACVMAALATHSGPKHGGACDRIEAVVREAASPEGARRTVRDRLRRGEAVPGFNHTLYPAGDPRTPPLLEQARGYAPKSERLRTVLALVEALAASGQHPSVDLGVVAVAAALGAPPGGSVGLFAVGRVAGWIAHSLEQRASSFVLRPRARYVGP